MTAMPEVIVVLLRSAAATVVTRDPMRAGQMMNLHKSLNVEESNENVDLQDTLAVVEILHRSTDSISKVSAIPALANTATITKSALVLALHRSKIPCPAPMDITVSMENASHQ